MYIYKIVNKINGKVYIGQTTGSIKNRWQKHCCISNNKNALSNGGKYFNMIKDNSIIWSGYIISECAREFNLSVGNTSQCLSGKRFSHKDYTFKYRDIK